MLYYIHIYISYPLLDVCRWCARRDSHAQLPFMSRVVQMTCGAIIVQRSDVVHARTFNVVSCLYLSLALHEIVIMVACALTPLVSHVVYVEGVFCVSFVAQSNKTCPQCAGIQFYTPVPYDGGERRRGSLQTSLKLRVCRIRRLF